MSRGAPQRAARAARLARYAALRDGGAGPAVACHELGLRGPSSRHRYERWYRAEHLGLEPRERERCGVPVATRAHPHRETADPCIRQAGHRGGHLRQAVYDRQKETARRWRAAQRAARVS